VVTLVFGDQPSSAGLIDHLSQVRVFWTPKDDARRRIASIQRNREVGYDFDAITPDEVGQKAFGEILVRSGHERLDFAVSQWKVKESGKHSHDLSMLAGAAVLKISESAGIKHDLDDVPNDRSPSLPRSVSSGIGLCHLLKLAMSGGSGPAKWGREPFPVDVR
jgi:hypothetical protein